MKASGRTIKFLYTIPNFHNPAGVTMSIARRAEVLDICRTAGVLVLEDNPYGLLGFDTEPMRALRADEAEGVIYLGSFSKTFSPGMRVGWALAPHAVREKLVLAQESATLCPPSFSQMAVSAYLTQHDWQGQIKQMREMYRERRDAMIEALDDFMPPACTWNSPRGGFFVWVTLPPGIDAKAMLPRAVTARVAYVPGHRLLRRRLRRRLDAAVLLLPDARADPRGRTPPGRRARAGDGAAPDVRCDRPGRRPAQARRAQRLRRPEHGDQLMDHLMDQPVSGPMTDHRGPCSSWPAGSATSATCRCARAAGSPRRCAAPGSRSPSATSTPACSPSLRADRPSCVVPMLHGETGEDGAIREMLELMSIPYVGATPSASRAAFDKPVAKTVVTRAGLHTPESVCLPHETFRELGAADVMAALVERLGLPLMVKPARSGSALGCAVVASAEQLPERDGQRVRLRLGGAAGAVRVRLEVAVPVIDDGTGPRALPAIGIRPDGGVYDYTARYTAGSTEFDVPADLSPALAEECARVAVAAHQALGLRDLSRSDLIVDADGTVWFLEVNVAPGFTETSTVPLSVQAAGLDLGEVVAGPRPVRGGPWLTAEARARGRGPGATSSIPRSSSPPRPASGCSATASP